MRDLGDDVPTLTTFKCDPHESARKAAYTLERLRNAGIRVSESSRLAQFASVLRENSEHATIGSALDPSRAAILVQAILEVEELFLIAQAFGHKRATPAIRALLERLPKDSLIPSAQTPKSQGRDHQYHLYLAAICQKAGLRPVIAEPPDIIIKLNRLRLGIAAKRIKSLERLEDCIRDGSRQLQQAALLGTAFVNVSMAFGLDGKCLQFPSEIEAGNVCSTAFARLTENLRQRASDWVNAAHVLGITYSLDMVCLLDRGPSPFQVWGGLEMFPKGSRKFDILTQMDGRIRRALQQEAHAVMLGNQ